MCPLKWHFPFTFTEELGESSQGHLLARCVLFYYFISLVCKGDFEFTYNSLLENFPECITNMNILHATKYVL